MHVHTLTVQTVYTSTGVCCTEEGLLNRCRWMGEHFPLFQVLVQSAPH